MNPAVNSVRTGRSNNEDHILVLCHMLSNRIGRSFSAELNEFDISAAEWRVLLDLSRYDNTSARSVSVRWAMDKMAVSRAIASLEERGWIRRRQDARDRRSKEVAFTPAGRRAYEKILPVANSHYQRLVGDIDKAVLADCREVLLEILSRANAASN